MEESYRKTSNRALHQVIYFVGVRRFGEAQAQRRPSGDPESNADPPDYIFRSLARGSSAIFWKGN
jgi:hypothetical protein